MRMLLTVCMRIKYIKMIKQPFTGGKERFLRNCGIISENRFWCCFAESGEKQRPAPDREWIGADKIMTGK